MTERKPHYSPEMTEVAKKLRRTLTPGLTNAEVLTASADALHNRVSAAVGAAALTVPPWSERPGGESKNPRSKIMAKIRGAGSSL